MVHAHIYSEEAINIFNTIVNVFVKMVDGAQLTKKK